MTELIMELYKVAHANDVTIVININQKYSDAVLELEMMKGRYGRFVSYDYWTLKDHLNEKPDILLSQITRAIEDLNKKREE